MTKKVQITIPGDLAWELWGIAEREGKNVGEVIRDVLHKKPEKVPDQSRETHMRIVAMVRAAGPRPASGARASRAAHGVPHPPIRPATALPAAVRNARRCKGSRFCGQAMRNPSRRRIITSTISTGCGSTAHGWRARR